MADEKPAQPDLPSLARAEVEKIEFVGMDSVQAVYADSFIVATTGEMASLFFFQNSTPTIRGAELGTAKHEATLAKCFARIVLSPTGFFRLLSAMAENSGFRIIKPEQEQE